MTPARTCPTCGYSFAAWMSVEELMAKSSDHLRWIKYDGFPITFIDAPCPECGVIVTTDVIWRAAA